MLRRIRNTVAIRGQMAVLLVFLPKENHLQPLLAKVVPRTRLAIGADLNYALLKVACGPIKAKAQKMAKLG